MSTDKLESAVHAKKRLKEIITTDRDTRKNDANRHSMKPGNHKSKKHKLSLDDLGTNKSKKPDTIIRLVKLPKDKLE